MASRCYLANWEDEGALVVVRVADKQSRPSSAAAVGWRRNFWGEDPSLRKQAERQAGRVEEEASRLLRELPREWPPDSDDKRFEERFAPLLQFVALHLVRTPGHRAAIVRHQENAIRRDLPGWTVRWGSEGAQEMALRLRSDFYRADVLLGQIPKMASMVGSMHWSLLRFEEPILITSDQPVVPVPLMRPGQAAPAGVSPPAGFFDTFEYRFAVDPRHALLLTWLDRPHPDSPADADYATACDLNCAVRQQADDAWFRHPTALPAFVQPPFLETQCGVLGARVHPGYTYASVLRSERRRRARGIVNHMIENDITNRIEVVTANAAA